MSKVILLQDVIVKTEATKSSGGVITIEDIKLKRETKIEPKAEIATEAEAEIKSKSDTAREKALNKLKARNNA